MKKALLTALIISASVCAGYAQDQKAVATSNTPVAKEADQKSDQAKRAQEWHNLLVTELKLTEDQIKKMDELNKAFGERRKAISNNPDLTDEVKKEKKMALNKAREAQLAQLLTPEQQARYKELVEAKMKDAPKKN